jgi:hypothetical protein
MSSLTRSLKWSRWYFTIGLGYPDYKNLILCSEYKDSDLSKKMIEKGIVEIVEIK